MPGPSRTSLWRRLRLCFRWCRILFLLLVALLLGALLYLNRVGVPDAIKGPLLAELERHGLQLRFDRLTWRWHRGLVAETVSLRALTQPPGPWVRAAEVELNLDLRRLLRTHEFQLASLVIRQGQLVAPLNDPGEAPEDCSLDAITARLRFVPDGTWELTELRAAFMGATLEASGVVTNAAAFARQSTTGRGTNTPPATAFWRQPLRQTVGLCRQLHFTALPEFRVRFHGDARDPQSFVAAIRCQAAGADTPWGRLERFRLLTELNHPPPANGGFHFNFRLNVGELRSAWGDFREAFLTASLTQPFTNAHPTRADWELTANEARGRYAGFTAARLRGHTTRLDSAPDRWRTDLNLTAQGLTTEWARARSNHLAATFEHNLNQLILTNLTASADVDALETRWARAGRFHTRIETAPASSPTPAYAWPWLTNLPPLEARAELTVTNLHTSNDLAVASAALQVHWSAPRLTITNLIASLYGGTFAIPDLVLDASSRQVALTLKSDVEAHALAPRFGAGAAQWLDQFRWARPPSVEARLQATLPATVPEGADLGRLLLPSVVVDASVHGEDAAYREVEVRRADLKVGFTNQVLHLHDFHVVRPEGDADLSYDLDTRTQEFKWRLRANLDPKGVGPAIDRAAPAVLELFSFNGPAAVAGEVWGRWGPERELNLALGGVLTNFTFRGEGIDELHAGVRLANDYLVATNLNLVTTNGWIRAPAVGVDFADPWVFVTNATAAIDPQRFARAIGPSLVQTLTPYRFDGPPQVEVSGRVPAQGSVEEADMQFHVAGGPFHFWRFNVPDLVADVHWEGDRVAITNAICSFYQGRLNGNLVALLQPDGSANLSFNTAVTNVNLKPLVLDTIPTTNRIEGLLHGRFDVAHANSADWKSWNGSGRLNMRDGLLWDLPMLSVLSPVLNAFVPGLGNNRASAATASFTIDRSVMHTEDLVVVANPAHLTYRGTLDFDWNVNTRVIAEIYPGAPIVGPILNILIAPVAKALEFKITGTLGNPMLEPVYIPKVLLPILRPFHTIKSIFPGGGGGGASGSTGTNTTVEPRP